MAIAYSNMKIIAAFIIAFAGFSAVFGQNEQSPIIEKSFPYNDWTYKSVRGEGEINLRSEIKGKKLVMVTYFAPWCPNWRHDVDFVKGLYDKYKANGFEVIGVGEYDPVESMKAHIESYKLGFPVVFESPLRTDKLNTTHYRYRRAAGDVRNWGSPWYIFLEPANIETSGNVITNKANVVNGELIKVDAEKFIRAKLGMPAETSNSAGIVKDAEETGPASKSVKQPIH